LFWVILIQKLGLALKKNSGNLSKSNPVMVEMLDSLKEISEKLKALEKKRE